MVKLERVVKLVARIIIFELMHTAGCVILMSTRIPSDINATLLTLYLHVAKRRYLCVSDA